MSHAPVWLINSFIYLPAAVLAVPLAKKLGLGSIIGYLAAGIAIGPWGLGLVTNVQDILDFAEFGVVLMLFLIGMELEPKRLWSLRRPIFGWGSARARDVPHWNALRDRGVMRVERELFDSSLRSARTVLELLGRQAQDAQG